MRRTVVAVFLIIFILTLIVLGLHFLIQNFLDPNLINIISLFVLALLAIVGLFSDLPGIIDRFAGTNRVGLDARQMQRNRNDMLHLVWNTWVEGVLKKSLYSEILIELGMVTDPNAVNHPWDMVFQMPNTKSKIVLPGTSMMEIFLESNGSLLILGEPGSGKTTMLLELCRLAIEQAKSELIEPIPIVLNLSSWKGNFLNKPEHIFSKWLISELRDRYSVPEKIGQYWIENDELLLLLDGLDEVSVDNQEACVKAINAFCDDHRMRIAICSRRYDYKILPTKLNLNSAVLINPLSNKKIDEYIKAMGEEFEGLRVLVQDVPEIGDLARTPLFLSILLLTYKSNINELLDTEKPIEDYRSYLFKSYINQMFKRRGSIRKFSQSNSLRWLSWLSRQMLDRDKLIFSIEDIQPSWLHIQKGKKQLLFFILDLLIGLLSPGILYGLSFSIVCGLIIFVLLNQVYGEHVQETVTQVIWVIGGMFVGLLFGLLIGMIFGLRRNTFSKGEDLKPTDKLIWLWNISKRDLLIPIFLIILFGLFAGIKDWLFPGLLAGLAIGLLILIFLFIRDSLRGIHIEKRYHPGQGIRSSIKTFFLVSILWGIISCLFFVLYFGMSFGLMGWRSGEQIVGWVAGMVFGLVFGLISGPAIGLARGLSVGGYFLILHFVSRWLLYHSGHIPWKLSEFLNYCTDRIFLRRVGGGYIFIHRMLMEHFAEMYQDENHA